VSLTAPGFVDARSCINLSDRDDTIKKGWSTGRFMDIVAFMGKKTRRSTANYRHARTTTKNNSRLFIKLKGERRREAILIEVWGEKRRDTSPAGKKNRVSQTSGLWTKELARGRTTWERTINGVRKTTLEIETEAPK